MSAYTLLTSSDTVLEGKWLLSGSSVVADDTSRRIEYLISNVLIHVVTDDSGWVSLFKDPQDLRYWELSYPDSSGHGGGAPLLRCIDEVEVRRKYSVI